MRPPTPEKSNYLSVFLIVMAFAAPGHAYEYRNFFGISWRGTYQENATYAKSMGYDAVFHMSGMENDQDVKDMHFYFETPEYTVYPVNRAFNLNGSYTSQQQADYEKYFAWKSRDPFPNNLATGWFFSSTSFSVQLDFQQQAVIELIGVIQGLLVEDQGVVAQQPAVAEVGDLEAAAAQVEQQAVIHG